MRKRKNRYQRKTAVLAALMAASSILAAGCGSEGGDSGGSSQTADGGETASIQEEIVKPQSEEEKLKHYDETITLTYAKSEVVTDYPSGQDAQNNALYDMWEEVMGIHVENQITASSDNFNEKMNLAITTGDIPDFAVVDASTMQSLMENELVMDMSGYYDAWATDKLKENLGDTEDAIWSACTSDGKAYGIPVINTVGDQLWELWIRKDWLDALGLEEPTTMEEFWDMCEAFTTQDPDGNGEADTYALYMDKDLLGMDALMAAYGAYTMDDYYVKQEDGRYIAGCIDEKAAEPLSELAHLYEIGGIDPEFAVKDNTTAESLIAEGKVGVYVGHFFSPGTLKNCYENVEGSDWIAVPIPPAEEGGTYESGVVANVYGYMYCSSECQNPEAIIAMLNWVCEGYADPTPGNAFYEKYNELAQDAEIGAAGANNLMPFQMASNTNWGEVFEEAIANGEDHVDGKDADYQKVISTEVDEATSWTFNKIYLEGYQALDFEHIRYSDYMGAPTETSTKKQAILDDEKLKTYIAMIMGETSTDSFGDFMAKYQELGGSEIGEEIKAYMESR